MEGTASDIAMSNHDPAAFEAAARETGFLGFGFYPRSDFMHINLGPKREWGKRFAPQPAFAPDTPPARERLGREPDDQGGGVVGVATVGAADVEVAQEVLPETQGAVLPIVPYPTASAGCSSGWRSLASRSRSTRGSND